MGWPDPSPLRLPWCAAVLAAAALALASPALANAAPREGPEGAHGIDPNDSIFDGKPGTEPEPKPKSKPRPTPEPPDTGVDPAPRPAPDDPAPPSDEPSEPQVRRVPVPANAAVVEAEKLVREVFRADYARRSPADRTALAEKLIRNAAETRDDPVARYVLLSEARDLAAAAGNVALAIQAIDELDRQYAIDRPASAADALAAAARLAKSPQDGAALLAGWTAVLDQALTERKYTVATRAAAGAEAALKHTKDKGLIDAVRERGRTARALRELEQEATPAREALKANPADPAANLAVARYLCFARGDWKQGLPLLAKGTPDPALKKLIRQDLAGPAEADAQADLGEGWLSLAKDQPAGPAQRAFQERAGYWFRRALPGATGPLKARLDKRLAELPGGIPFARIAEAAKAGGVTKSPRVGGGGGGPFQHTPEGGGILTGVIVTSGNYAGNHIVGSVQPIYRTPAGRTVGPRFCNPGSPETVVEARDGYAVGGIVAKGGDRLDGFKLVFMRLKGDRLDPNDRYESDWLCGRGGGGEAPLGCDGKLVVGLHGGTGLEFDGMGIVQYP